MRKTLLALAALSATCAPLLAPPASAWHFASKRACLRSAHAPDCGPGAVAHCVKRRACTLEPHRTLKACAEWSCRPKR